MNIKTLLIVLLAFTCSASFAQSKRNKRKRVEPEQTQTTQPTALNPSEPKKEYVPKAAKKKPTKGATYTAEAKFYERQEQLERAREKEEKEKAKPQYSDPMYFGHKRPPKKNKPGKMKYCKECGIKH
jgi:hypothetical protein